MGALVIKSIVKVTLFSEFKFWGVWKLTFLWSVRNMVKSLKKTKTKKKPTRYSYPPDCYRDTINLLLHSLAYDTSVTNLTILILSSHNSAVTRILAVDTRS